MPVLTTAERNRPQQRGSFLLDATIRDFSGGWNLADNDLNLDPKYSVKLENLQRSLDGSLTIRPGTILFADVKTYLDEIVNTEYFSNHLICVGENGKIVAVNATADVKLIWDDDRASNLLNNPTGWATTNFVSFAPFNGDLHIANGVNKPLKINSSLSCEYLVDLASGSNANTPIARYMIAHGRFLVMAGSATVNEEDKIFICSTDVAGTWLGDGAPNDAVNISLGSRVPLGSQTIKGLGRFRGNLMVMFEEVILPGTLGIFDDGDHTPTFDDAIENIGSISHRIIQTVGENMYFGDFNGVTSIRRALITGTVTEDSQSDLVDPAYRDSIKNINSTIALEDKVWSLWDSTNNNYMIFMPNAAGSVETTEYRCMVYKRNKKLKIEAWQDWRDWKFRCGCRSSLKSIFLCEGTQIFRLGDERDRDNFVFRDFMGDQEMWDDDTPWSDYTGWTPIVTVKDSGMPIKFTWELPWSDNNERFLTKNSRFINFDTIGDNKFLVEMFTDNIYKDKSDLGEDWVEDDLKWDDGFGWDVDVLVPTLSMAFEGGDGPGFGADEFGEDFGGGRPTRLESLYAWTAKYKLQKLRMSGDAIRSLKFISITLAYLLGSSRR